MAGLTSAGFQKKTLESILTDIQINLKKSLGSDVNLKYDSVLAQIYGPLAIEIANIWEAAEAAYNAQTLSGAEGRHLDNILIHASGFYRLGSKVGFDTVLVKTDDNLSLSQTIPVASSFTDTVGNVSHVTAATTIGPENTKAYEILFSDLDLNTDYVFEITDDTNAQQTFTLSVTDEASKYTGCVALKTFIETAVANTVGFMTVTASGFYLGTTTAGSFDVLPERIYLDVEPLVGSRWGVVEIETDESGYHSIIDNDVYTLSPAITGIESITSTGNAYSGRDVETDAAYLLRYAEYRIGQITSSASAIKNAILDLDGTSYCEIYENPTSTATEQVPVPYSSHIIVYGGNDEEIAGAILKKRPININLYGDTQVFVRDEYDNQVAQWFSKAEEVDLEVKLNYSTNDGTFLTNSEKSSLEAALVEYQDELSIGDAFYTFQATGRIVNALGGNRLTGMTIDVRPLNGTYVTGDYIPTYNQKVKLTDNHIYYNKV